MSILENETGATSMRGSFYDGQAWFHDAGGLIAVYAGTGHKLIVDDGDGGQAYGFIGEAGSGETLDLDIARTFAIGSGSPTIDGDSVTFADEASHVTDMNYWTIGKIYKVNVTIEDYVGTGDIILPYDGRLSDHKESSNGTYEYYYVPIDTVMIVYSLAGHTAKVTVNSIQEVTEPNANAVHIYKEYSLDNEGWNKIDGDIRYNADTDWDFDVCSNDWGVGGIVDDNIPPFISQSLKVEDER